MIDIDLRINGKSVFEYETSILPRVGESLEISHEKINGNFKVTKVTHKIFQEKETKKIINYAIVEAED